MRDFAPMVTATKNTTQGTYTAYISIVYPKSGSYTVDFAAISQQLDAAKKEQVITLPIVPADSNVRQNTLIQTFPLPPGDYIARFVSDLSALRSAASLSRTSLALSEDGGGSVGGDGGNGGGGVDPEDPKEPSSPFPPHKSDPDDDN